MPIGETFTQEQKQMLVDEITRYKDVIESKTTEKSKSKTEEKNRLFEQFSKTTFKGLFSADQLKTCWNNLRARTSSKLRKNDAESKKTGGGKPDIKELSDIEVQVSKIINVAKPIEGVLDTNTSLMDSEEGEEDELKPVPAKVPKTTKTERIAASSDFSNVESVHSKIELQSKLMTLDDIRKSHFSSMQCINELKKNGTT